MTNGKPAVFFTKILDKKAIGKNCAADSNNLFISWNKDDNMYIPIKLKIPVKNKNLSSKKIKITSFPLLEDSQKKKKS